MNDPATGPRDHRETTRPRLGGRRRKLPGALASLALLGVLLGPGTAIADTSTTTQRGCAGSRHDAWQAAPAAAADAGLANGRRPRHTDPIIAADRAGLVPGPDGPGLLAWSLALALMGAALWRRS